MFAVHLAYSLIKPTDRVLDLGGASSPFRRANQVLDFMPYSKRNPKPDFLGQIPEHFSESNWLIHDVCDRQKPFPFKDGEFDFVVCGHLLEDVRDPFWLASEIQRVAKRGYLEVPTRFVEQMYWVERKGMCGYAHHRWYVDPRKNERGTYDLAFIYKNQSLHSSRKFQVRKSPFALKRARMNTNLQFHGMYFNGPFKTWEDLSSLSDNARSFMLDTVRAAKAKRKELWDLSAPTPTELSRVDDLAPGLHLISDLKSRVTKHALLFDPKTGGVSDDVRKYERSLGLS